jgi:pseudouridine kinase
MAPVVVIGGANVDVKGRAREPFVAATSNPGEITTSVGGVARNIAHNLALLGCEVALLAAIADDANGEMIQRETAAAGVDVSLLATVHGSSGIYLAILDESGELVAAVNDMQAAEMLTPGHLEAASAVLEQAPMIVADCNLSSACLAWLFAFAGSRGKRLLVEPISVPKAAKILTLSGLTPAFAITPNRQQLVALTGERDMMKAVADLHGRGFENVVVHCGAEGVLVSGGTSGPHVIAPLLMGAVTDVTGAGDAAVAGLVFGIAEGHDLVTAARFGQAAAALKLSSRQSVASGISRDRLLTMVRAGHPQ